MFGVEESQKIEQSLVYYQSLIKKLCSTLKIAVQYLL